MFQKKLQNCLPRLITTFNPLIIHYFKVLYLRHLSIPTLKKYFPLDDYKFKFVYHLKYFQGNNHSMLFMQEPYFYLNNILLNFLKIV